MKNEERRIFHENEKMKNIFKNIHIVFCLAALILISCAKRAEKATSRQG